MDWHIKFHKLLRRVCEILLFVCLCLPAGAQTLPDANAKGAAPAPAVSVVPAANDGEIAGRLQRILTSTGWFTNPTVSVREGVVFLDGTTDTAEHRNWAGTLAGNTEGTVAVVNRIALSGDVGATFERAGQEIGQFTQQAVAAWPIVVLALVILAVTWLVAWLVGMIARRLLEGRIPSPLLLSVVVRSLTIPIFLLGLYFVLQVAGLTRLALTVLGGTGLIGIIIGFAFRDIAENFLASLLLSMRNPFRSGDLITVADQTGIVQSLNTRATVLLTLDGNHVQIPNAVIYKSTIKNYSSIPSRRAEFLVGIGYDSSAAKAQSLIAGVLKDHPAVLDTPEPLVLVDELGAATVNLRVQYWFDSATYSPAKINSAVLRLTKNALMKGGIEMPDPAREVVFPRGVPLVNFEGGKELPAAAPKQKPQPAPEEDTASATEAEGNLESETVEMREQRETPVPEAGENLLKP